MFKPYESKPVTRMAFQITAEQNIAKMKDSDSHYSCITYAEDGTSGSCFSFKAYQWPQIGDWIVRLTEDDTYHCTDAVFRERNIVP